MTEEWRAIEGYEGFYEVSDQGRVRSLDRKISWQNRKGTPISRFYPGKIMALGKDSSGYFQIGLTRDGVPRRFLVHHLVMKAFGPRRPENHVCDHRNGDITDNKIENLRWASWSDNGRNRHTILNKNGVIGVSANPRSPINPYVAMARPKNGKRNDKVYLGSFPTKEAAAEAYRAFRDEQFSCQ